MLKSSRVDVPVSEGGAIPTLSPANGTRGNLHPPCPKRPRMRGQLGVAPHELQISILMWG